MSVSKSLSPTAQAILLLTSYFSKASNEMAKPLTNAEWGRFALWLKNSGINPADLLGGDPQAILKGWVDARISIERIIKLLSRGHSLAFAIEKWHRAGLWVITRSDPEYPGLLKQRLKNTCPPVLFGCGNRDLLNVGGLAIIGSRNANRLDLAFTEQVAAQAAVEGITIISGGARGVDEAAMLGASKQGGKVVGVMADSLLKAATSNKWRKSLMNGSTVLVSPFYPEVGFNVGNAMARNKYIYCLANSSLVIHSGKRGGTFSGAQENLRNSWVSLWVKRTTDVEAGNADLVEKGGQWLEDDIQAFDVAALINNEGDFTYQDKGDAGVAFAQPAQSELFSGSVPISDSGSEVYIDERQEKSEATPLGTVGKVDFFELFTFELQRLAKKPVTLDVLSEVTQLHRSQLTEWLKRAVNDGVVKKLYRPVRYQIKSKR